MKKIYDMAIIGGGPGGYTAALYAARAGLSTLVLEKLSPGGQMAQTHQIDNYPGFDEGIDGYTLGEKMKAGAERFGAETEFAEVYRLSLTGEIKHLETSEGDISARTVVLATGAGPRQLGLPGEEKLTGRGVHYCAACDGMFYRGKTVVVVGGGNSAVADALQLSRLCEKVILVHRRDQLRATRIYHSALEKAENIEIVWNSTVSGLLGDSRLSGVRLQNRLSNEEQELSCDGVFISIGRKPATQLVKGQLALDDNGYIIAGESTETEIPGVYAVGDLRQKELRQVITAAADGAIAAHHAEQYLASR